MAALPDFHGPHVEPPLPGFVKLTWYAPHARAPRVRVVAHTCECREVTYELCAAAGLGFIRRVDHKKKNVHETVWTLADTARRTFGQILNGEAR